MRPRSIPDRDLLKDLAETPTVSEDDPIFSIASGSNFRAILKRREEYRLTKREAQFVFLLSHGWDYEMIAEALTLSYDAVRTRVQVARAVLQARNNEHLIGLALRAGLID